MDLRNILAFSLMKKDAGAPPLAAHRASWLIVIERLPAWCDVHQFRGNLKHDISVLQINLSG
jgi:hypothetical protein